jgi:hypothetical protein
LPEATWSQQLILGGSFLESQEGMRFAHIPVIISCAARVLRARSNSK